MSGAEQSADAVRLVLCTAPRESADVLARTLLEERLIACANLLGPVRSIYRWEGRMETSEEVLLLMKTSASVCVRLRERIVELHAYEVPEVLEFAADGGLAAYVAWVHDSCAP